MSNRLRILFVVDYCLFVRNNIYVQLCNYFAQKGHHVHLLAGEPGDARGRSCFLGEQLYLYKATASPGTPAAALRTARETGRRFGELMRSTGFDVAVFHHPLSAAAAILSGGGGACPKVYFFHSPWYREFTAARPRRSLTNHARARTRWAVQMFALRHCRAVLVASQFMREELRRMGPLGAGRVCLTPIGVDIECFRPPASKTAARERLGLPTDRKIILTVRRLVPRMGIEYLVRAMPLILQSEPKALLIVGGEGRIRDELTHEADRLGISDATRFLGFVDPEDLPTCYQAADVFVLPTTELEGFGMVTIEAMACGTPVVGTTAGATPEVLTGLPDSFLVPPRNPQALAEGVLSVLRHAQPDQLGSQCRRFVVENYSWDVCGPRYEHVIRQACR